MLNSDSEPESDSWYDIVELSIVVVYFKSSAANGGGVTKPRWAAARSKRQGLNNHNYSIDHAYSSGA